MRKLHHRLDSIFESAIISVAQNGGHYAMPMFDAVMRHLNRQFDSDRIGEFAAQARMFAPGKPLDVDVLRFPDAALARRFQAYLNDLPDGFREVLRSLFYLALSASPPIPMSFSWAPACEYELTMWQQACGILIQFKAPVLHETGRRRAS